MTATAVKEKWEPLHFSITGEFVTNQVRELWAEGRFGLAKKIADDIIGMSEEEKFDLIRGKKKLVGVNRLALVDDDWKVDPNCCHNCIYPDPEEMFEMAETYTEHKECKDDRPHSIARSYIAAAIRLVEEYPGEVPGMRINNLREEFARKCIVWEDYEDEFNRIIYSHDESEESLAGITHEDVVDAGSDLLKVVKEAGKDLVEGVDGKYSTEPEAPISMAQAARSIIESEGGIDAYNKKWMEAREATKAMEAMTGVDNDTAMKRLSGETMTKLVIKSGITNESGWIARDSKFYPCEHFEHLSVMGLLDMTEGEAEDKGWIKISYNKATGEAHLFAYKKPTKRQANLAWDWATKYKKEDVYKEFMDGIG